MVRYSYSPEQACTVAAIQLLAGVFLFVSHRITKAKFKDFELEAVVEKAESDAKLIAETLEQARHHENQIRLLTRDASYSKDAISQIQSEMMEALEKEKAIPEIEVKMLLDSSTKKFICEVKSLNFIPFDYHFVVTDEQRKQLRAFIRTTWPSFIPSKDQDTLHIDADCTFSDLLNRGKLIARFQYRSIFHNKYSHHKVHEVVMPMNPPKDAL